MLCVEPILTHRELEATLVASIPEFALTIGEREKRTSLRASIVKGGLKASLVSGLVAATIANGSLTHTAVSGSLRRNALQATLTSGAGLRASLYGKPSVTGTLTSHPYGEFSLTAGVVEASLDGKIVDSCLAVYCPVNYITSCFSLGGWYDDLGWDDNKGWKD